MPEHIRFTMALRVCVIYFFNNQTVWTHSLRNGNADLRYESYASYYVFRVFPKFILNISPLLHKEHRAFCFVFPFSLSAWLLFLLLYLFSFLCALNFIHEYYLWFSMFFNICARDAAEVQKRVQRQCEFKGKRVQSELLSNGSQLRVLLCVCQPFQWCV